MRVYSFPPIADSHSKVLILGTMPGRESLVQQQYYAHPRNAFWRIMLSLCRVPFTTDYAQRYTTILQHNIAVWDVLQSCERKGSADSAIINEYPNDLGSFLDNHTSLQCIICNGKTAARLFRRYYSHCTDMPVIQAPSTSPAYAQCSYEEKLRQWHMLFTQCTDILL